MTTALSTAAASCLDDLLCLSARIGHNPLLVQAASGNTSVKMDGVLWIKASGKWLAHADREDILIPVPLDETVRRISMGIDPAGQTVSSRGTQLGTSVETAMHALLPHRVVVHVHSVNTIALAVRRDGAAQIAARFRGMDWAWVPYVPSGLALAHAVEEAMSLNPAANVLVLANHGLVVGADTCEQAEQLLFEVECRVGSVSRSAPEPDIITLHKLASSGGNWRVPRNSALHAPALDATSRRILCGGVLYPCQAIFLTSQARILSVDTDPAELSAIQDPFVLIEEAGMLVRNYLNPAETATLDGLSQVLRRIPESAPIRYLTGHEVSQLLCADVYHYRERVEHNSAPPVLLAREAALPFHGAF